MAVPSVFARWSWVSGPAVPMPTLPVPKLTVPELILSAKLFVAPVAAPVIITAAASVTVPDDIVGGWMKRLAALLVVPALLFMVGAITAMIPPSPVLPAVS